MHVPMYLYFIGIDNKMYRVSKKYNKFIINLVFKFYSCDDLYKKSFLHIKNDISSWSFRLHFNANVAYFCLSNKVIHPILSDNAPYSAIKWVSDMDPDNFN